MRLPALAAVLVLAACTAKDASETAATDSAAATAAAATAANEVTITATDYAFEAPAEIPAGLTNFRMVDNGKELHHATLIKLEEGKTFDDMINGVPFFYYILHIFVIHLLAYAFAIAQGGTGRFLGLDISSYPEWYGASLPGVYLAWAIVVLVCYLPCRQYADFKRRRADLRWPSYL